MGTNGWLALLHFPQYAKGISHGEKGAMPGGTPHWMVAPVRWREVD
jgi:hypothetical protein